MLERNDLEHVRLLIDHGADPGNINDPDGLLRLAVRHYHDHPVREADYAFGIELLAPLAKDIDAPDAEGRTGLMWVAASNNQRALAAILEQEPKLDGRSSDGRTAMMWAAGARAKASAETLRASGADESLRDHAGRSVEDWSIWADARSRPSAPNTLPSGQFPLHERIARSRASALAAYLEQDTWSDEHRIAGYSPLHLAASLGDIGAVETLIGRGAPIDLRLEDRTTPLMSAATNGNSEVVLRPIEGGADLSLRNGDHERALDLAISFEHWDTARILLNTDGSLSRNESSLIESLVISRNGDLLREAFEAGAAIVPPDERDGDKADRFQKSSIGSASDPMIAAARIEGLDLLKILHEFPKASGSGEADLVNIALHYAADAGELAKVKYLIDHLGADADSLLTHAMGGVTRFGQPSGKRPQPVEGYSALSRALDEGHLDVVRFLVEREATITGRTRRGAPPVTFAVIHRQHDLLQYFLEHDAPTELVDLDTKTALHHASMNDDERAVRLLLEHGANPEAKTEDGRTPLDLAREKEASKAATLLEIAHEHGRD